MKSDLDLMIEFVWGNIATDSERENNKDTRVIYCLEKIRMMGEQAQRYQEMLGMPLP